MLAPEVKRNLFRIIPFGFIWCVFGLVYTLVEGSILGDLDYYPSTGNPYHYRSNLILTPVLSLIIGLLAGALEVLYLSKRFKQKRLWQKIVYKTLIYLGIMFFFLSLISLVSNAYSLQTGILDERVFDNVWIFMVSPAFWNLELYVGLIMVLTLFYLEVSDNVGQQVLANFLTGRYHTPKEETRIFMFLDMKSSTAHAEKLGHLQYFRMLKDYYQDLSQAIVRYGGEIYQYVGDEVVLSWRIRRSLPVNNCLLCFFEMKEIIAKNAPYYQSHYRVVPSFKAGIHVGQVTVGELGVIKKDIAFSGDVLNTTARVQALCNQHQVDLLITGDLMHIIDLPPGYHSRDLGSQSLRGRDQQVQLYTVEKN